MLKIDWIFELQKISDKINDKLLIALAEVHDTKCPDDCLEVICYVGYIPVCPRDVILKQFWVSSKIDNEIIEKCD